MNPTPRLCLTLGALLLAPCWLAAQTPPASDSTADSSQNTSAASAGQTAAAPAAKSSSPEAKPAAAETNAREEPVRLDTVQVTGSRIPQLAGEAAITPVVSLTAAQIATYGVSNLEDLRRAITQLGPNTSGNEWTDLIGSGPSPGLANRTTFSLGGLNLAASTLGGVTLILVDGRRLSTSGQAFSGLGNLEDYDLNGIPIDAIERIDILSGGASAIYGADAMAGVINIVLKKNAGYDTSTATLRYDGAFNGGGAVKTAGFTTSQRRGKFSLLASVSYEQANALPRRDRWFTATDNLTTFGGQYDNRNSYVGAIFSADGSNLPGLASPTAGIPAGSRGASSAAAFAAAGTPAVYDAGRVDNSTDPYISRSALLQANYDFAPWAKLYTEFRLNKKVSTSILYPTLGGYYPAYAYSYGLTIPAGVAGNPFGVPVQLNKVFLDLPQAQTSTSLNPSAMIGLDGDFHAWTDWHYDSYFSWSRSEQDYNGSGGFDTDKLSAALASGSAPILIYDSAAGNPNAPGVLQSFFDPNWNRERSDTPDFNLTVRGPVLSLPAGSVQVAAGGEWLENRAVFASNPGSAYSSYLLSGAISRSDTAAFAETQIPIISSKQGLLLLNDLEANFSVRHDDYSDVGGATTPRYAGLYRPFSWLTLRASRSEGFKPASLWDLYAPYYQFPYTTTVGPGTRYPLTDPLRNGENVVGPINTFEVGHPDLKPTTSVSKNAGVVVDVPFFKGLSFGVDFTKTEIANAIGGVSYQTIINDYPSRVVRGPASGGLPGKISALDTSNVNTASYLTESVTYSVAYDRNTRFGSFSLNFSYTNPTVTQSLTTATAKPTVAWLPKRAGGAIGWQRGPLGLSLSAIYQSSFNLYPAYLAFNYDQTYAGYIEWNPRVSYDFGRDSHFGSRSASFWTKTLGNVRVSLTIDNVFDHQPSLAAAGSGLLAEDDRGSRYVIELAKKF